VHMITMRRAFAGITAGFLALFAFTTPGAQAATPTPRSTPTICTTGYRDHGDYNRLCLTTGTPHTAAHLWNSVPEGKPGHLHDDMTTQRNLCAHAARHGGIMAEARELVGDMTYDNYRNNEQVNRWVGQDATLTCAQLGYRI
jgi:hypothetical protein